MTQTRTWSPQQEEIFGWFAGDEIVDRRDGTIVVSPNLVVRARAGTGKTTTILEGINRAPERNILLAAFNKRIAEELTRRLANPHAESRTLHALGYSYVRRSYPDARVCSNIPDRARWLTERAAGHVPEEVEKAISKLHTLGRETMPHAESGADLAAIQEQFDACELDSVTLEKPGYGSFTAQYIADRAAEAMIHAADEASWKECGGIDFADMLYLPIRLNLVRPEYDLIVVDEAQDMTTAQLELAIMSRKRAGRICIVGDDKQAIYGFRGADSGSIDRLKDELEAVELPLTVTYRCGHAIVREAQELVPDFEASDTVGPGEVGYANYQEMYASLSPVREDYVLSRTNAPLATVAMTLIRSNVRVRIAGKDIGAGLMGLVRRLDKGRGMPALLAALDSWEEKECARLIAQKREHGITAIQDRAETIRVLAEGVVGPRELLARIESLFADSGRAQVVCSTVHKAKGLETPRVFVLKDTMYPTWGNETEEKNVVYVAVTRAIDTLTWVKA